MTPSLHHQAQVVPLNAVDRLILLTDHEMRRRGLPAFTCQIPVWFHGRLDMALLRHALADLPARYLLVTARLVGSPGWAWRTTGERTLSLREESLTTDAEAEFVASITRLLHEPMDLASEAPVRFVVLHQPNGDDVLVLQYSHVLMDGHGAVGLINELLAGSPTTPINASAQDGDVEPPTLRRMWENLRRARQRQRRDVPITLPEKPGQPLSGGLLLRWIDADDNRRLKARIARAGMTANLSLAAIASGFRAVQRQLPKVPPHGLFETALRYNTRSNGARPEYFRNHYCRISLAARADELADWDRLVRQLAGQFRAQFTEEDRQAFLQSARIGGLISRWFPRMNRRLLRRAMTLTVGAFSEIAPVGRTAFGATTAGGFLHPVPFLQSNVIADLFPVGERLLVAMTYATNALSDDQARRLLDDWVADLLAE